MDMEPRNPFLYRHFSSVFLYNYTLATQCVCEVLRKKPVLFRPSLKDLTHNCSTLGLKENLDVLKMVAAVAICLAWIGIQFYYHQTNFSGEVF